MSKPQHLDDLTAAARLFARLLVRELDGATLTELQRPDVIDALRELGIELPASEELAALAHRYFELFLHPDGSLPPVQSLWRDGQYGGDAAAGVRKIADASGLELAVGARGAAPDHLGCILMLWAELVCERPELAELLVTHHLAWAPGALRHAAQQPDFYGAVCRAIIALVRDLTRAHTHSHDPQDPFS